MADSPTNPGKAPGPPQAAPPTVPEGWMLPSEMDQLGSVFGAPRTARVEPRVEPRAEPRVEPRVEPRPPTSSADLWADLQGPASPEDIPPPPPVRGREAPATAPVPPALRRGLAGLGQPLVGGPRSEPPAHEREERPVPVVRAAEPPRTVSPFEADARGDRSHAAARSVPSSRPMSVPPAPAPRLDDVLMERRTYVPLRVRPRRDIARAILLFLGASIASAAGVTVAWLWVDRPPVADTPVVTTLALDATVGTAATPPVEAPLGDVPVPVGVPVAAPAVTTPAVAPVDGPPVEAPSAAPVEAPPTAPPERTPAKAKAPRAAVPTQPSTPTSRSSTPAAPALYAQTGMLRVLCDERAVIWVDGKKQGWSNDLPPLELTAGAHTIKAVSKGRTRSMQARIDAGRMSEVQFRFAR